MHIHMSDPDAISPLLISQCMCPFFTSRIRLLTMQVLDLLHDLSGRQLSDSDTESDVSTSSSDNGRIAPAGIQAYSGPASSSATLQ